LETRWEGVHQALNIYARDAIQPRLPSDLWALAEERVYVETDSERTRQIIPDVHVSRLYPAPESQPSMLKEGAAIAAESHAVETVTAEPLVFELRELEFTEGYIEIREQKGGRIVTVIEFLSRTNKSGGTGQEIYLEKQAEVLRSDASLVEIDLVRAGQRVLALPRYHIPAQHRGDCLTCISPGWKRNRRELYPMPLRQRLPVLPIPLRRQESPVPLNLQALVDQAYANGRYDRLDYSAELDPPWTAEDAAWAEGMLKAAGKR